MEEFREHYVKQVRRQLDELPRQKKKTMLDGLRRELEEHCNGSTLYLLPNQRPEEVARELMDSVDPSVYKQRRMIQRRRFWCTFSVVAVLLVAAIYGVYHMYHALQKTADSYAVITVASNSEPYKPVSTDSVEFMSEWASENYKN